MGMMQKALVGSLVVGAGAIALAKNQKKVEKVGNHVKKVAKKATKKVLQNGRNVSKLLLKSKKEAL